MFHPTANRLRGAVYATCLVGKWHHGFKPQFSPLRNGFDYFFWFNALNGTGVTPVLTGKASAVPHAMYRRSFQRMKHKAMGDGKWKYMQDEKAVNICSILLLIPRRRMILGKGASCFYWPEIKICRLRSNDVKANTPVTTVTFILQPLICQLIVAGIHLLFVQHLSKL